MPKKHILVIRMIAGFMVACMAIVDMSLFWSVNSGEQVTIVNQDYEIAEVMADGSFDGSGSDKWHADNDGSVNDPNQKHLYNILEIMPTERKGTIGFMISGCEPFDIDGIFNRANLNQAIKKKKLTESELRIACMDALVNPAPGSTMDNNYDKMNGNDFNKIPSCVKEYMAKSGEGGIGAFNLVGGQSYTGYYKYVGDGNGVYSIALEDDGTPMSIRKISYWDNEKKEMTTRDDIVMISRFFSNSYDSNIRKSTEKNDYIWVYTDILLSKTEADDKNIYVKDHKRIKYTNNNKFFDECYPEVEKTDDAGNVVKGKATSDEYKVSVVTRNPINVSLQDIEDADLIIVANPPAYGGDIYHMALQIYNRSHHQNDDDLDEEKGTVFWSDNDLSFEKVLAIYERVVVREDVAFVGGKWSLGTSTNNINTNIKKLFYMLFLVKDYKIGEIGSGRRMFMDYLKSYVDEPGEERLALRTDTKYFDEGTKKANMGYSRYMPDGLVDAASDSDHHYMNATHPFETRNSAIVKSTYTNGILVPLYEGDTGITPERPGHNWPLQTYAHKTTAWYEALGIGKLNDDEKDSNKLGYFINENCPESKTSDIKYKFFLNIWESRSNTTDYVYIAEKDDPDKGIKAGDFVRDGKYSDKWYSMDANGDNDKWFFTKIAWETRPMSIWPWNKGCLHDWFLCKDGTEVIYNYDMLSNSSYDTHLYMDYYDTTFGGDYIYRSIETVDDSATYKNQSIVKENDLYKDNGGWIRKAVENRDIKREIEDDKHIDDSNKVYYMINVNVVNGDGVNSSSANKVMYYNNYEKADFATTPIPVLFNVRTSTDINRIEFYKGSSLLVTYTAVSGNNVKDTSKSDLTFVQSSDNRRSSKIVLKNITTYPLDEKVNEDGAEYVYTLSGEIGERNSSGKLIKGVILDTDLTGVNNDFKVKVYIQPIPTVEKSDEDELIVAERSFFDLN